MGDANSRKKALARLEALAKRVGRRNQDLSQEEAEELADRFTREVIEEMIEEGKIKYERVESEGRQDRQAS